MIIFVLGGIRAGRMNFVAMYRHSVFVSKYQGNVRPVGSL